MPEAPRPALTPIDIEHLRLLVLFNKIGAWIFGFMSCVGLPYTLIGFAIMTGTIPDDGADDFPSGLFGALFFFAGLAVVGWMILTAIASWKAAQWIEAREKPNHIYVVAGIQCLYMPLGTALGVVTFIVLSRPQIRALFQNS